MATNTLQHYSPPIDHAAIEKALMAGDLQKLDSPTRLKFYHALCQSTGLNPLARPYVTMKGADGAVHWYASKDAAEQLRKLHRISTTILSRERTSDDLYVVTVRATDPTGRQEENQGIEYLGNLKGQPLGNAMMKAATKALRRVTLAICGLGLSLADDASGPVIPFDPQTGDLELPPEPPEAQALLTGIGKWLRQRPSPSRDTIARAIWGCGLHEMPHLSLDDLAAGWHRIDEGRAPLEWQSATLEADLAQWQQAHAYEAIRDVFDRSEGRPE